MESPPRAAFPSLFSLFSLSFSFLALSVSYGWKLWQSSSSKRLCWGLCLCLFVLFSWRIEQWRAEQSKAKQSRAEQTTVIVEAEAEAEPERRGEQMVLVVGDLGLVGPLDHFLFPFLFFSFSFSFVLCPAFFFSSFRLFLFSWFLVWVFCFCPLFVLFCANNQNQNHAQMNVGFGFGFCVGVFDSIISLLLSFMELTASCGQGKSFLFNG